MLRTILLVAGIGLAVYLVVETGPREILGLFRRVGWGIVPIAGLFAGHQALRALALRLSVVRREVIAYVDVLAIRFSGEAVRFVTSTGPFLAEPSKALLLGRRGLTKTEGFAATIAEFLVYTLVSAVMLAGAVAYLLARVSLGPGMRTAAIVLLAGSAGFVAVSMTAIWKRTYLIGGIVARLRRIPSAGRRIQADSGAVRRTEDLLLAVLRERPRRLLAIFGVELAAHLVLVVEMWWLLRLIGIAASFDVALVLESAGKFTMLAFFFIPGQVGAAEGVNMLLFEAMGLSSAAGVGVALARRARSALAAVAGAGALALVLRRRPDAVERL